MNRWKFEGTGVKKTIIAVNHRQKHWGFRVTPPIVERTKKACPPKKKTKQGESTSSNDSISGPFWGG